MIVIVIVIVIVIETPIIIFFFLLGGCLSYLPPTTDNATPFSTNPAVLLEQRPRTETEWFSKGYSRNITRERRAHNVLLEVATANR